MKFIYATDLHGDFGKYNLIKNFAVSEGISIIHLGSDLLPKGSDILRRQKNFVKMFLKDFYRECSEQGIILMAFFGNDDVYTRKICFREYGSLLDENPVKIEGYEFKAYPYVCDYPFALKTACKLDFRGWKRPFCQKAIDVNEKGFVEIQDIDYYLNSKTTIQEDLENFHVSKNTIIAIHMPPYNLELDVCGQYQGSSLVPGIRVGSKSIYDWISREQPLLCLSGHIHESHTVTGIWKNYIGNTLVIQPGQMKKTKFVVIEIENSIIKAELVELE